MQFDFTISYMPGKQIVIADTLSSAPVIQAIEKDHDLLQDMNFYVKSVIKILPIIEKILEDIQCHQWNISATSQLLQR